MNTKGYLLLSSYLVMAVLEILSMALFSKNFSFVQSVERNQNRMIGFNMAEAGVDRALVSLASDLNYAGAADSPLDTNNLQGGYRTKVTDPDPNGSLYRFILSTGYAPSSDTGSPAYEQRVLEAYAQIDTTPFEYASFADSNLTLNGTPLIDSYDSRNGAYGGLNMGTDGDIASDGTIQFIGNPLVKGDIINSPGIDCKPGTTNLASSGSLTLSGGTNYTIAGGTYRFSSINISGSAKLILSGPATIYVDGAVYIGGNGVATSSNIPSNFLLIATGSDPVAVAGNASFYAGVYAPSSSVEYSGTEDFYGSVIAKDYKQSGTSDLHYDVAMKGRAAPCYGVDLVSWRETNTAAG